MTRKLNFKRPKTRTVGGRDLEFWILKNSTPTAFARMLKVTLQAVDNWIVGRNPPRKDHREQIQKLTGVPTEAWFQPVQEGHDIEALTDAFMARHQKPRLSEPASEGYKSDRVRSTWGSMVALAQVARMDPTERDAMLEALGNHA